MIKLLISIVNYNSYSDTVKLVEYIYTKLIIDNYKINFFIVDNSSDKNNQNIFLKDLNNINIFKLANKLDDTYDNYNYVYNAENNGFGAANNIVFKYMQRTEIYDAIWILNNDLILDINTLHEMFQYLNDDKYKILGSSIYSIENKTKLSSLGTVSMDTFKGFGSPILSSINNKTIKVDAVSGTSMFLKSSILNKLKFDESFFMYVEENDLCYRFKQLGIQSYIIPKSKVYHYSGKTFGNNQSLRWYYKTRNLLKFKSNNRSKNLLLIPYLLLSTLKNYKLDKSYIKAYFYGVKDYLNDNMGKTKRNFT